MGKYLSPPNPEDSEIKCAIIFYPADDGAFFLNAVRGQLSELARPFIWEGDRAKTNLIAQLFTITDLMTDDVFFGLDCADIPLIVGDEDMNINVNCGCCDGSSSDTLICYGMDGNPIVQTGPIPVDYTPPIYLDETIDPEGELPSELPYETVEEYQSVICGVANAAWYVVAVFLSVLETIGDALAAVAAAIVAVAAALPGGVVAALGAEGLLLVIEDWAAIYAAEDISDKLSDMRTWMDDNRQEVVCAIYNSRFSGATAMWASWSDKMADMVDSVIFVNPFVPFLALRSIQRIFPLKALSEWLLDSSDIPLPTTLIDCSLCTPEYLVGFTKANLINEVVTYPTPGLSYTGINWVGGTTWESAGGGNRISFAYGEVTTPKMRWLVRLAADSSTCQVTAVVNTGGGSRSEVLVAAAEPGNLYSGIVDLAAGESMAALNCEYVSGTPNARLSEFYLVGTE